VQNNDQQQTQSQREGSVDGVDDEHHNQSANEANQGGVPGKEFKGRPVILNKLITNCLIV